jgi:broad specificity phosphatase PhoE
VGSLFLVRHSLTAASEAGRNLGQRGDPPLTDAGVGMAKRLAASLAAELRELGHRELRLVTSPARRCRQTAAPVAARLGIPARRIEVEPGLMEIDYGAWDGLTEAECRRRDPRLRARWERDPFTTRCPDGESGQDVATRSFAAFDALDAWAGGNPDRCAVVIAHNHVNRLRLCAVMGWPMRSYRRRIAQDPAAYSLLTLEGSIAVVRRLNVTPA